jgi:4-hydroxybenzoyl-CoA thioesterase
VKTSQHHVTVHWGDADPAAIVYYPNYFRWFDQGTTTLFESAGFDWDELKTKFGVVGVPVVEAKARFLAPCRFRDSIIVESGISRWTSKTFHISHKILNRGAVAVEGYEIRVLGKAHPDDPARLKACTIPAEFKRAFE